MLIKLLEIMIISHVSVLAVGVIIGLFITYYRDKRNIESAITNASSTVAKANITAINGIYLDGLRTRELTLNAIGMVNRPELERFFTAEVKSYAEDIYKQIESNEIESNK